MDNILKQNDQYDLSKDIHCTSTVTKEWYNVPCACCWKLSE